MRPEGDPPLCECHGVPKGWQQDARSPAGGYWLCRPKLTAAKKRYEKSEKGRARRASRNAQNNARSIWIGGRYYGKAKTAEEAEAIQQRGRELVADFKQRQREATDVACS